MTVLTAAQSAGVRLLGRKPSSLFSTTDAFAMELADLANEAAADIAKAREWQKLKKLATMTGDGATIAFNLPDDYDRMLKKGQVHSKNWQTANYCKVRDEDEWIYIQQTAITGTPGRWIILGGKFNVYPAIAVGEEAKFYYISNKVVGGTATTFTTDGDTFVLPERLLTLSLIWRWRAQKRMDYAEDMANYEIAVSQEYASDKGTTVLKSGSQRVPSAAALAYPGVLGQS